MGLLWAGGVVAGRCAGVVVVVGVGAGFVCERGVVVAPRCARQTHIMERFTRCGSIALDDEALH